MADMTEAVEPGRNPGSHGLPSRLTPAIRFILAGAANTLLSIAVYQAVLFMASHVVSYLVAYAAGIVFAYVAYARHVFNAELSTGRFLAFALFYCASGGIGVGLNAMLIEQWALHPRLAVFVTVLIMLPVNYFGSKWCLGRTRGGAA